MNKKALMIYAGSFATYAFLFWRNKRLKEDKLTFLKETGEGAAKGFGVQVSPESSYEDMELFLKHVADPITPLKELSAPTADTSPPPTQTPNTTVSSSPPSSSNLSQLPAVTTSTPQLPMPKLHLEYFDSLRNPYTNTVPYKVPIASPFSYRLLPNSEYLRVYKNELIYNEKGRDNAVLGDYYAPQNVANMIKYLIQPAPREDASYNDSDKLTDPQDSRTLSPTFSFTLTDQEISSLKTDLAYLLEIEMRLQSERAAEDKGGRDKDLLFTKSNDGNDYRLDSYSQIGDLAYSREGAAILWTAINRIGRNLNSLSSLVSNSWSIGVAKEIKRRKKSNILPAQPFIDFVDDFMKGKYPNEIGKREAFVHYPRQTREKKSVPDWALPLQDPNRTENSKNTETILINDLLSASGTYDYFSTTPTVKSRVYVLPYSDPRR